MSDLLFEEVFFVEEKYDGGVDEPLVVADGLEEFGRLCHPVHFLVFCQHKVVAGQGDTEDDGGDALEAVYPLLPLRPLSAHVKHFEVEPFECELRLDDTCCLDPRAQDVLLRGDIVRTRDPIQGVQIVRRRIVELVFARPGTPKQ